MKTATTIAVSVLSAVIICVAIFLPIKDYNSANSQNYEVLTLWHIDSFEGGVGSRASYLRKVAEQFEKSENCLITVVSETTDDALEKIRSGLVPDLISYSVGMGEVFSLANQLKSSPMSAGGEFDGKFFAACWAFGGYVKMIKKGSMPQKTVISKGLYTYPEIACYYNNIDFSAAEFLSPQRAFDLFRYNGDYALIGTQRDIYRLKRFIDDYEITPLSGFTDLMQYISVTSSDENKKIFAQKFVDYLLSDGQKNINDLGLMSVDKNCNNADNGLIGALFDVGYDKTLSVFASEEIVEEVKRRLFDINIGQEEKTEFLKNIIKSLK